jgi:hypothetical protein
MDKLAMPGMHFHHIARVLVAAAGRNCLDQVLARIRDIAFVARSSCSIGCRGSSSNA